MKEIWYTIASIFESSFEILKGLGMLPNIILIIIGAFGLSFCMKIVTTKKNILE
tara:strand:+ start:344 stop:505 length:162 start_codon:yes stop_codon:yes gene_type:complete